MFKESISGLEQQPKPLQNTIMWAAIAMSHSSQILKPFYSKHSHNLTFGESTSELLQQQTTLQILF